MLSETFLQLPPKPVSSLVTENLGSIGVVAEDWRGGSEEVEDYNSVANLIQEVVLKEKCQTGYSSEISCSSEAGIKELKIMNLLEKEQLSTDIQEGMPQTQSVNKIVFHIGLFIRFLQFCYRVSEWCITLLLNLLISLLLSLYSLNPNTSSLKMIAEKSLLMFIF